MKETNDGRCRVGAEHNFLSVLANAAATSGWADEKGAGQYVPSSRWVLLNSVAALRVFDDELYVVGVERLEFPVNAAIPECGEVELIVWHSTVGPAVRAVAVVGCAFLEDGEIPEVVVLGTGRVHLGHFPEVAGRFRTYLGQVDKSVGDVA